MFLAFFAVFSAILIFPSVFLYKISTNNLSAENPFPVRVLRRAG